MSVKHVARTPLAVATSTRAQASARNSQLRARFPARPAEACWPETTRTLDDTVRRLTSPPFLPNAHATRVGRRHGVIKLLRWLSTVPGETWQQRWLASGVEDHPGAAWSQLPLAWLRERGEARDRDAENLSSGLLMLICGDVIRPGLPWMLTRTHRHLASAMAQIRDPDGFARLHELAAAGPAGARMDAQIAETRIAILLACKGRTIEEITVGDCVELVDTLRRVHARGGQKKVDFYLRLRALDIFPADAPATIRAFGLAMGQLSIEELVDRYRLECSPIRGLIVDYLRERQPSLDFASIDAMSRTLAGLFWAEIEALAPGIDSLRLPPEIAQQWKENLRTKTRTVINTTGERVEITSPRLNARRNCCGCAPSTSISPSGRWRSRPAGGRGRCLVRSATPRSAAPRNASTASPVWTNAPASGYRSCPSWCAPPTNAARPPRAGCTPPPTPRPARSSPTPTARYAGPS